MKEGSGVAKFVLKEKACGSCVEKRLDLTR